ncbi:MAG: hypothetical protein RR975_14540 [Clostridia bacterium]
MSHFNLAVFTHTDDSCELEALLAPFTEDVDADSPYAEFEEDDDGELDATTGKRGYWFNPNAKHDYWLLGGRWRGQIKLQEGKTGRYGEASWTRKGEPNDPTRCDCAKVRDCDFSPSEAVCTRAVRFWEVVVEGKPLQEGENQDDFISFYSKEHYLKQYKIKEQYADSCSHFATYAYLTPAGEWVQTGEMGWFGLDDATAESRKSYETAFAEYLKEATEQDLYINIVDCHI